MATYEDTRTMPRRTVLFGTLALPVLTIPQLAEGSPADPMAPKCIRWPMWAGHDRAGCVMTPAELARRYADNAKRLRYAMRRLSWYQVETGRAVA